ACRYSLCHVARRNDVLPKAYGSTSIALPPRPNTLPALVAGKGKPNDGCPKVVSATTSLCECAGFQPLRRPSDCAPPMDFPSCAIASADSRSRQTAICFPQTSFNHPRTTIPGKHWGLWHRTPLSLTDRPPHSRGWSQAHGADLGPRVCLGPRSRRDRRKTPATH